MLRGRSKLGTWRPSPGFLFSVDHGMHDGVVGREPRGGSRPLSVSVLRNIIARVVDELSGLSFSCAWFVFSRRSHAESLRRADDRNEALLVWIARAPRADKENTFTLHVDSGRRAGREEPVVKQSSVEAAPPRQGAVPDALTVACSFRVR